MTAEMDAAALPVFSPRLDEVLGMMLKGDAPNAGRFCGHCYTPLGKRSEACAHCGLSTRAAETAERVPAPVIEMYKRMRKRESLIVNSFAFGGIFLAVLLFMGLVAVSVYAMDGSIWMLIVATAVLLVGGRVFAGILGGWIGDDIAYRFAQERLRTEWAAFETDRTGGAAAEAGRREAP